MRRGSRTDPAIVKRIRELWLDGHNAAQITRRLEDEYGDPPQERTVRGIVSELRPPPAADDVEPWDFMDPAMSPEDARLVMDLISEMPPQVRDTSWRPSLDQARRYVRIRRAYPEADWLAAWMDTVQRPDRVIEELIDFSADLIERKAFS
jgi:hypothetical protein